MSEQQNIGIVSRGDLIRAIRQYIADSGVDIHALIREAVPQAITNRLGEHNIQQAVEKAAKEAAKNSMYEIRAAIASEIAKRVQLKEPPHD